MFEFALVSSGFIVGVFVFAELWQNLRFLGAYITGFGLLILGVGTVNFYVDVKPLPPALQSVLADHPRLRRHLRHRASSPSAPGSRSLQLLQARREAAGRGRSREADSSHTFPSAERLENLAYRVDRRRLRLLDLHPHRRLHLGRAGLGQLLGLGHQGGVDLHHLGRSSPDTSTPARPAAGAAHAHPGWRIIGFATVLFNFTIVNLFFKGLHAYSGL